MQYFTKKTVVTLLAITNCTAMAAAGSPSQQDANNALKARNTETTSNKVPDAVVESFPKHEEKKPGVFSLVIRAARSVLSENTKSETHEHHPQSQHNTGSKSGERSNSGGEEGGTRKKQRKGSQGTVGNAKGKEWEHAPIKYYYVVPRAPWDKVQVAQIEKVLREYVKENDKASTSSRHRNEASEGGLPHNTGNANENQDKPEGGKAHGRPGLIKRLLAHSGKVGKEPNEKSSKGAHKVTSGGGSTRVSGEGQQDPLEIAHDEEEGVVLFKVQMTIKQASEVATGMKKQVRDSSRLGEQWVISSIQGCKARSEGTCSLEIVVHH